MNANFVVERGGILGWKPVGYAPPAYVRQSIVQLTNNDPKQEEFQGPLALSVRRSSIERRRMYRRVVDGPTSSPYLLRRHPSILFAPQKTQDERLSPRNMIEHDSPLGTGGRYRKFLAHHSTTSNSSTVSNIYGGL